MSTLHALVHSLSLLPHDLPHTHAGPHAQPQVADTPSPNDSGGGGGVKFPNPAPSPPKGVDAIASDWIAWFKWGAGIAGILGLIMCAIMMMIGRRNRSYLAGEGAAGIPWVIGGLSLVALATSLVTSMMQLGQ